MSAQVKSRPATSGIPRVWKNPGETNLNRRSAGTIPLAAYVLSCSRIGSRQAPLAIHRDRMVNPTEETPGIAAILFLNLLLHPSHMFRLPIHPLVERRCETSALWDGSMKTRVHPIKARKVRIIRPEQISSTSAIDYLDDHKNSTRDAASDSGSACVRPHACR